MSTHVQIATHPHSLRHLAGVGATCAVVAAAATTAIAAIAQATDVSLKVSKNAIPLSAFPFWTIVATIAGIAITAYAGTRRRFLTITMTATALSLIPALAALDDAATAAVLVTTHLRAAAIIIPALARNVRTRGR